MSGRGVQAGGKPERLTPAEAEVKVLLETAAPIDGVGPQRSRLLRLALDSDGYPRGDVLLALRDDLTADEALELEAVSLRRRDEVSEISRILAKHAAKDKPK